MGTTWASAAEYQDIRYELGTGDDAGIAKITINRPEVRNAFRPETVIELSDAFTRAREDLSVGVVILTGEGTEAFCSAATSAPAAAAAATSPAPTRPRPASTRRLDAST